MLPERRYSAFVGGTDEGTRDQGRVDEYLVGILVKYEREIMEILDEVDEVKVGEEVKVEQKEMLRKRWRQIKEIVRKGVDALGR